MGTERIGVCVLRSACIDVRPRRGGPGHFVTVWRGAEYVRALTVPVSSGRRYWSSPFVDDAGLAEIAESDAVRFALALATEDDDVAPF